MSELKGRVIPFPTKKVITTFHFIDGKSIYSVSSDVDYIDNKKEAVRDCIQSAHFTIYPNFIINNQYITHVEFEYESNESNESNETEEKKESKDDIKIYIKYINSALIFMMITCVIFYIYFSICKK